MVSPPESGRRASPPRTYFPALSMSTDRSVQNSRLTSPQQAVEDDAGALDAADDRGGVPLLLDPRTEDLEIERPCIPRVDEQPEEALGGQVTVPQSTAVRHVVGAELVVTELDQGHQVDVLVHELVKTALVPGRVEVDHHAHVGHAGEVHGVADAVEEADVAPERVRRLDCQPNTD